MSSLKFLLLLGIPLILSCTKHINQYKDGKEHGKWIIKTTDNTISKGRYIQGKEIGRWKLVADGKLYKREKFKGNDAFVKFYYPNGKMSSKGHTRYDRISTTLHWYYSGEWFYYNEEGKLTEIRIYAKGVPIEEKTY